MKERPILFSAPMVRAILDGRKTQTRRIVKPQPSEHIVRTACMAGQPEPPLNGCYWEYGGPIIDSPYGRCGDRLWVRETHVAFDESTPENTGEVFYRADDEYPRLSFKWRPSIFMRRIHSRITLEVTGSRIERLQDISEADAIAEGIQPFGDGNGFHTEEGRFYQGTASGAYCALWDAINGEGSWPTNPWVWVVEFKRVGNHVRQ